MVSPPHTHTHTLQFAPLPPWAPASSIPSHPHPLICLFVSPLSCPVPSLLPLLFPQPPPSSFSSPLPLSPFSPGPFLLSCGGAAFSLTQQGAL